MTVSTEELLDRLSRGEDPERLLTLLLRDDDAELVKLAAVPRRLDAGVLATLLGDGADPHPALQRLATLRLTEPVPGTGGAAVRLRHGVRDDNLQRWWTDGTSLDVVPDGLRRMNERLAAHFDAAGDELEALYHHVAVDPIAAAEHFRQLFDAADHDFDLARCGDLLAILEQSAEHLPPEVERLKERCAARLAGRSLWIDDWYRSSRFYAPDGNTDRGERTCDVLARLLAGDIRTLELRARGGMGKTMHLRWLVARLCVPEGIACARIDFDEAEEAAAISSPWLVMLAIATQLAPQIPGGPFDRLVRQYGDQLPRLYPAGQAEAPLPRSVEQEEAIGSEVLEGFDSAVAAIPDDQRWVVILDTLEVPLLRRPEGETAPLDFITQLSRLRDVPSARLIFAGRHAVREKVAEFTELFPGAELVDLPGFELPDRRRYLTEKRGVEDQEVVEAAARMAGEVPFKLALVADVIDGNPEITPDVLRAYEPDVLYLVDRVLERIDEGPRWVLRYGVVPRVLDLEFVREVMRPYLGPAMSGADQGDRVAEARLPDGRPAAAIFPTNLVSPGSDVDVDALWAELRRYAGDSSWVTVPQGRPDMLLLHADVVIPMRRLLAENEARFLELQRDAFRYFEARERREPEQAARSAREAVFHRFQYEGSAAEDYWRTRLRAAPGPEGAPLRLALARDLSRPDYVDDDGPLPWVDGKPLVDSATLLEARFEEAWANIQIARSHRLPRTAVQWRDARLALEAVESSFVDPRGRRTTAARLAMAWTAIHIADGDDELARARFKESRKGKVSLEDRLWTWLEFGPALANGLVRRLLDSPRLAPLLSLRGARTPYWRQRIRDAAGERDAHKDRLDHALEHYTDAVELAEPDERDRALRALASLRLRTGENAEALQLLGDPEAPVNRLLRARALVRRREPLSALSELNRTIADLAAASSYGTLEASALEAEATELRGRACAMLLDVDSALRAFVHAADCWSRAGSAEGTARAHARRAAFLLHAMGDVSDARIAVAAAEKAGPTEAGSAWTKACLVRTQAMAQAVEGTAAARAIRDAIDILQAAEAPPRRLVSAAITAIAVDDAKARQGHVELLIEHLERISPDAARLPLVARMRLVESLDGVKARTRSRLRRLVPTAADALRNWEARDRALLLVADAEVDRVLGDRTSALAKLADAQPEMTSDPGGAGLREWLEAVARAGGDRGLVDRVRADAIMRLQQPGMEPEASAGLAAALGHATGPTLDAELEEILLAAATRVSQRRRDSRWEGGIAEVLARSARERGALDDAEAHTLHAARVYDRLGDPRSRDRLLASPHAASELRAWPDDGALDVVIGLTEGTFRVEIREPGHEPARAALQDADLAHVLATSSASGWGEAYSRPLAKRMAAAPDSLSADLWRVLDTPPMREALSREGDRDLRLRLRDPRLEAAPWELAGTGDERLSDHPSIRCLYRGAPDALPNVIEIRSLQAGLRIAGLPVTEDGTLGPDTRRALEDYQRQERLPATGHPDPFTVQRLQGLLCSERSVTVVRNGGPPQGGGRGRLGSPVERLYSTLGFHIEALAGPEAGIEALATRPTAILHFATPLVETGGSVGLDMAGDPYASWSRREGDWLTAAALDQAFQTPLPAPIVILDPPLAGSRVDAVTTLLLRNTFAGELFALGNTRAVFGVGLASLEKQGLLHRALIEPIASGASFGETIQNVRQLAGFAGSTLHARSAEMLPPWR